MFFFLPGKIHLFFFFRTSHSAVTYHGSSVALLSEVVASRSQGVCMLVFGRFFFVLIFVDCCIVFEYSMIYFVLFLGKIFSDTKLFNRIINLSFFKLGPGLGLEGHEWQSRPSKARPGRRGASLEQHFWKMLSKCWILIKILHKIACVRFFNCFRASPNKTMQNRRGIVWESHF